MTIGQFQMPVGTGPAEWYSLPTPEILYTFPVLNFDTNAIIFISAYHAAGTATPSVTVDLLNSAGTSIKTETLKDYDTGSSRNVSELITEVPAGAVSVRLQSSIPAFVSIQPLKLK